MKTDSHHSHDADPRRDGLPAEGIRTVLSLLLVVHLFCLLVAVASNFRPVSPMRVQLREVPLVRPYLQLLNMDLAYNYHLTFATESDFDHRLTIDLDPSVGGEPIELPAPNLQPGVRRQRYFDLTRTMAENLDDDVREGILPRTVAAGVLAQHGVEGGVHRLRLEYNQPPPPPNAIQPEEAGYRIDYDANLIYFDGELGLVKRAPAGEVAPVVESP